jgi:hypothetical protein
MIYEIKGICPNCVDEVTVLVHNDSIITTCPKCNETPFGIKRFEGVIYVVKNKNQDGVKIGLTTKTVEERCKALSSTGVAGKFLPKAIFPSNNIKRHEKTVHKKLAKFKLDKEHFSLEVTDAILKVFRALNRKIDPIFYDDKVKQTFFLKLQKDKINMVLRLQGKVT